MFTVNNYKNMPNACIKIGKRNNGPIYESPAGAIIFTNAVGFLVNYVL